MQLFRLNVQTNSGLQHSINILLIEPHIEPARVGAVTILIRCKE